MTESSTESITAQEVEGFYAEFQRGLQASSLERLEKLYSLDYILVRPNGSVLTRSGILEDLRLHEMHFVSFEQKDVVIRTHGPVGILTATVKSVAMRDGKESKTHARQLAIFVKQDQRITISHFQSTTVADLE